MRRTLLPFCLALAIVTTPCTAQQSDTDGVPVGVQLSYVAYWNTQWPWKDVMKLASPWFTGNETWVDGGRNDWDTQVLNRIPSDTDGYPLALPVSIPGAEAPQIVHALMMRGLTAYPAGRYVCLYDGDGTIEFEFDATVVSRSPGRIELDVTPTAEGIHLRITSSAAGNHVRNIRVLLPGTESTYLADPFHPDFVALADSFVTLRFMLAMNVERTTVKTWADRATPTMYTQASDKGASVEDCVAIANRLRADAWFCMPHAADDDYVARFAAYVRNNLDPDLQAYVEYSNEVWNPIYDCHWYAQQQGVALGLSTDPYEAGLRFASQRAVEIFRIWEGVFGGTSRFVRVIAAQSGNPWTGETMLDWRDAYREADALAVAPYFGGELGTPGRVENVVNWTVDQVLDACLADITGFVASSIRDNRAAAATRGLPLIAYEGGQHLVGVAGWEDNPTLNRLFQEANRHPRMYDLYTRYLDQWKALDGGLFIHHTLVEGNSQYGTWGLLESMTQDPATAPKFMGVVDFMLRQ